MISFDNKLDSSYQIQTFFLEEYIMKILIFYSPVFEIHFL